MFPTGVGGKFRNAGTTWICGGATQNPFWQLAPAWHTTPQAPQFTGLVKMLVSHPSAGLPLQSRKLTLQTKLQLPLEQAGAALVTGGQTLPHIPQLFLSLPTSVHCGPVGVMHTSCKGLHVGTSS